MHITKAETNLNSLYNLLLNSSGSGTLTFGVDCCSVSQLYLTLCNPMDCSSPGFPVLYHLQEFAQTQVH